MHRKDATNEITTQQFGEHAEEREILNKYIIIITMSAGPNQGPAEDVLDVSRWKVGNCIPETKKKIILLWQSKKVLKMYTKHSKH